MSGSESSTVGFKPVKADGSRDDPPVTETNPPCAQTRWEMLIKVESSNREETGV